MAETNGQRELPSLSALAPEAVAPPASEPRPDFESVYAEFFPFIWRCLKSLGVAPTSLDDAAQDVFVVVHRQLSGFAGRSSLRTWLYGIARKVAFNHRRRQQRREKTDPLSEEPASPSPDPQRAAEDSEAARFLTGFTSGLSDARREVFILAVIEQWSAPEVAEALQLPLNTVYSRLRSARLEFQAAVARRQEEHATR